MRIRKAEERDFPVIYSLVKEAFATARVSDGTEQDYVNRLRQSENYLPELALVAEEDALAGFVMLTRQAVTKQGRQLDALLLAPLAVALPCRNRGLGGRLVKEGLRLAQAAGYGAVFLVGSQDYYGRFGFQPAGHFGITNKNGVPPEHFLACQLAEGALKGWDGGSAAFLA